MIWGIPNMMTCFQPAVHPVFSMEASLRTALPPHLRPFLAANAEEMALGHLETPRLTWRHLHLLPQLMGQALGGTCLNLTR